MTKHFISFTIIVFFASCMLLNASNHHKLEDAGQSNISSVEPENKLVETDELYPEVRVTNIEEFIKALASNTTILVESGNEYIFTDSDILGDEEAQEKLSKLDTLSEYYDGTYIHDISNLVIKGIGETPPTFLQPDGYNHVLKFRNVENIEIENIKMGHSPELGHCRGGVILFENGENIKLNKLELFGSGTEGMSIMNVENFTIKNSLITKCTEQLSTFSHVTNAVISNCRFAENEICLRGFAIYKSTIEFIDSEIDEKYPFYLDVSEYEGSTYDQLFCVDEFDAGTWYSNYEFYTLMRASFITFKNTMINGDLVNGEMITSYNKN